MRETYIEEIQFLRITAQPVILFGAGSTAEFNLNYFRDQGIFPAAFCDNAEEKKGQWIKDIPVMGLGNKINGDLSETKGILDKYPDAYFYITTQLYYKEIIKQLLDAGVDENNISRFDIICQLPWEEDAPAYYRQSAGKLWRLYECLGDEESRRVLVNRIEFFQTRERKLMMDVRERGRGVIQYFDEGLIDYQKVNTFVDLGTYTGDTIEAFLRIKKEKYFHIYGFEPDENLYRMAKKNLGRFNHITIVEKGTSDFDGEVRVNGSLGVMQSIENDVFDESEAGDYFKVCRLDTFFKDVPHQRIDMIKMDIEGAELSTLRGAKQVIEAYVPILAVCVYHKEDDIFSIPEYVYSLSCGERYKMYLRHYSDNQTETVAYFIPEK